MKAKTYTSMLRLLKKMENMLYVITQESHPIQMYLIVINGFLMTIVYLLMIKTASHINKKVSGNCSDG